MGKGGAKGKGKGQCGCGSGDPDKSGSHLNAEKLLSREDYGCCPTDPIMLLVFSGFCIGLIVVMSIGFAQGDTDRIVYGTAWDGHTCDTDHKNQYWPNPIYYKELGSICLNGCTPNTTSVTGVSSTLYCTCNPQLGEGFYWHQGGASGGTFSNGTSMDGKQMSDIISGICDVTSNGQTEDNSIYKGDGYVLLGSNQTGNYKYFTPDYLYGSWQATMNPYQIAASASGGLVTTGPYISTSSSNTGSSIDNYNGTGVTKYMMPFCNYGYGTSNILNRCIPGMSVSDLQTAFCGTNNSNCDTSAYNSYVSGTTQAFSMAMQDLATSWYVILVCFFLAAFFGFGYLKFMQLCATCCVWTFLLLVNVALCLMTGACFYYYGKLKTNVDATPQLATYDTDKTNMYICLAFGIAFAVAETICLCTCVCLCKQINTACKLLKLAAEGTSQMYWLLTYPIVNAFFVGIWFTIWVAVTIFLASAGSDSTDTTYGYHTFDYDDTIRKAAAYWFFGLLWITEFTCSVSFTVCSFHFCVWFFTPEKNEDKERDLPPMFTRILSTVLMKFVGTIAFGSLIIAIIQTLRIVLEYVEHKRKEFTGEEEPPWWWKFIFCCLKCCLYCLEKCMKFMNKNVYIQTVLRNSWFCTGICHAAAVMLDHMSYIAVTQPISTGMLYTGKVAITFMTAAIGAYWVSSLDVSSIITPFLVIAIIAYGVAMLFCEVYETGIDTMLMCFCEAEYSDDTHSMPTIMKDYADDDLGDGMNMRASADQAKKNREGTAIESSATKTIE
jgi:hypothetical protein